jgi:hypothetical protein
MPKKAITAAHHMLDFYASLQATPLGSRLDFLRPLAHHDKGSSCAIRAACLPGSLTTAPRAQHVGLATTTKLVGRSRSVVVESSLAQMASFWAPAGQFRPEPGYEGTWNGASGRT